MLWRAKLNNISCVQFYKRRLRSFSVANSRCRKKTFSEVLEVSEITFSCIHDGKTFKTESNEGLVQVKNPISLRFMVAKDLSLPFLCGYRGLWLDSVDVQASQGRIRHVILLFCRFEAQITHLPTRRVLLPKRARVLKLWIWQLQILPLPYYISSERQDKACLRG